MTGHNSEGPTDTTNSFTLMEIRAAKVAPLITTVNGLANNGSPITLASGATVTVNPNGEFVYDPAGGTFSPPTTDTFSVVSGYGGVVTDTGTVTVNISGPGSTVYVDDLFAGLTIGDPITDADLGTTGDQDAIFGTDAFASIGAAVVAAAPGATIVVNSGTYSERVALTDEKILRVTGVDVAGTVSIIGIGVSGGGMIVIDGASGLVAGDCSLADGSVVLNGNGPRYRR